MPGFERTINGGPARIISAVLGGTYDTEEEFFENMAVAAANLGKGVKALWVDGDGAATLYSRTDVAVPDEGDPEGPLFDNPSEVVSAANGRWINCTVRVAVYFGDSEPTFAWERIVGVTSINNEERSATFGLIEPNTTYGG